MRLAVLASGQGTLLEAIVPRFRDELSLVIVDRHCRAIEVAPRVTAYLPRSLYRLNDARAFDREEYTHDVVQLLQVGRIDLVAMAGFMTVLGEELFDAFPDRVLNSHPSLLPAFPGAHAVRDALNAGVRVTGCTVHVATSFVDDGRILYQEAVNVEPDDDERSLHGRIKEVERRRYPEVIAAYRNEVGL